MKKVILTCFALSIFHFSLLHAQNNWIWGEYGYGYGYGNSVTIDNNGNYFLTGYIEGGLTLTFGSYVLSSGLPNTLDAFITKYDKNGNIQWASQTTCTGLSGDPSGFVASTDKLGNAYLTANFSDTMKVGTYKLIAPANGNTSYIVKYTPNGSVVWAKQSNVPAGGTISGVQSNYICTDINANSYITGIFADTAIFGKDTIVCNIGGNAFLVKYDSNGNVKWAKQPGCRSAASGGEGEGEAVDKYGNIYLTGYFVDTVYFGTDTLKGIYQDHYNTFDFFLAKYDSSGNVKWARQDKLPSVSCYGQGYGATCDRQGNVYVVGEFIDTLIFNKDTLISNQTGFAQKTNFFVTKFDSAGNFKWAIQDNTTSSYGTSACAISSDTMGHIYVSANVGTLGSCAVRIGKDTSLGIHDTSADDAPAILLKLDTGGNLLCANIFPYAGAYYNSIASDPTGNYVCFGGTLLTEAIFGKDTVNPWSPGLHEYPIIARWQECDPTLDVNNITVTTNNAEVKVYPNPNSGIFTFAFSQPELVSGSTIQIYNVLGERVFAQPLRLISGVSSIDISNQPSGVYLYRVIAQDGNLIGEGKVLIEK